MQTKEYLRWFLWLLVLSTAASIVGSWYLSSDPAKEEVYGFLKSNAETAERTGGARNFSIARRVTVSASESQRAYTLYYVDVVGMRKNVYATVRLDPALKSSGTAVLTLVSLEP